MSTKREIIALAVGAILAAPGICMLFNESCNYAVNLLGLIYFVLLFTYAPRFLPKWIIDYFKTPPEVD